MGVDAHKHSYNAKSGVAIIIAGKILFMAMSIVVYVLKSLW